MGKRIFRISALELLQQKDQLLNKEISLVLNDGRVFTGVLKTVNDQICVCENMLKKKFETKNASIKEVIYDVTSNY